MAVLSAIGLNRKKTAPKKVNSFLSELTYIVKEGKIKLEELLPLKVYPLLVSFLYEARALDKTDYLMLIFFYCSSKPYDVTPHLNRLVETVQMRGCNICFYAKLTKYLELCETSKLVAEKTNLQY